MEWLIFVKTYTMKYHLLFIFTSFLVININAQESSSYTLKLNNVSNHQEAKEITDVIRSIINDGKEPFKNYPHFNDDTDTFEFKSSEILSREIFEEKLGQKGHEVLEYKKEQKLTPISQ